jgi:hypothetical protein
VVGELFAVTLLLGTLLNFVEVVIFIIYGASSGSLEVFGYGRGDEVTFVPRLS